jgi:hypothetical protein
MRERRLGGVFAWLLCAAVPAQDAVVPREHLRPLERVAGDLARGGRGDDWRDLVAVLIGLGLPPKDTAALRTGGAKELARVKKPADATRFEKPLREAVHGLAARLSAMPPGEATSHLARQVLLLDAEHDAANAALGHERIGTRWVTAGEPQREERRALLRRAMQDARRLVVPLVVGESKGDEADAAATGAALLTEVLRRPVVKVTAGALCVHSARSAEQTARMIQQTLRALAFAQSVARGSVAPPEVAPFQLVMVDRDADYRACITAARQRGWLAEADAERAAKLTGFYLHNGVLVDLSHMEVEAECALLVALDRDSLGEAALVGGFLNWVCKAMLGAAIPSYAWLEHTQQAAAAARTSTQDARELAEREEMLRLAEAGLAGSRSYMRYLAARREDPPWTAAMSPQLGQIQGENLLKATFVAEFLLEEGRLVPLAQRVRDVTGAATSPERIAKALDEPMAAFEQRWRTAFVGLPPGLLQRLRQPLTAVPADAQPTLAALGELRRRAGGFMTPRIPIGYDPELSAGCRAHAGYLVQHPEHAARWPDAHEQNPEHADWSAAGAWAGAHSVIAPGTADGPAALKAWMGTFYHRLPLLDPGLLRVGFAHTGGVAVLDSGSMVATIHQNWWVVWPPDGMRDVPTRFVPELPNPVPGEDQARFGYPITLQLGQRTEDGPAVAMVLHAGGANGPTVPCWFSSPEQPTNADCAPPGACCLIPKEPLERDRTYTVVARIPGDAQDLVWSFRT